MVHSIIFASVVVVFAGLCCVNAQDITAVAVDSDQSITITVPDGQEVYIQYASRTGEITRKEKVATSSQINELNNMINALNASLQDVIYKQWQSAQEELASVADLNEVRQAGVETLIKLNNLQGEVETITEDLTQIVDDSENKSTCLANIIPLVNSGNAVDSCPEPGPKKNCPNLEEPDYADTHGSSTVVGAIRSFKCHEGFNLIGSHVSTCKSDLTWSPPTPTCAATVNCQLTVSDQVVQVFVDGVQVSFQGQNSWYALRTFSFTSDAKTIAIKTIGPKNRWSLYGQMAISCDSVGKHDWHDVSNRTKWRMASASKVDTYDIEGSWALPSYSMDSNWLTPVETTQCMRTDDTRCRMGGSGATVPVFICDCDLIKVDYVKAFAPEGYKDIDDGAFHWYRYSV
eukprot:m.339859 g.339859  ORF g.339859 m.339859 type:complete len:402 (-) comp19010_c0_seq1:98-1303(-)